MSCCAVRRVLVCFASQALLLCSACLPCLPSHLHALGQVQCVPLLKHAVLYVAARRRGEGGYDGTMHRPAKAHIWEGEGLLVITHLANTPSRVPLLNQLLLCVKSSSNSTLLRLLMEK